MAHQSRQPKVLAIWISFLVLGLSGCGDDEPLPSAGCSSLTGSPWSPSVTGVSADHHSGAVGIGKTETTGSGALIGLGQGADTSKYVTVQFTLPDLGAGGSVTLVADVTSFPASLSGGAFPVLMSLSDGVKDFINISSGCGSGGVYTCSGSSCSSNASCGPSSPSAYVDRDHWLQHQNTNLTGGSSSDSYPSVNTFPTCNWSSGTPSCAFNSTFFSGGRLRAGTYTAKYVLVANGYVSLEGHSAGLKLTVIQKSDSSVSGGALDVNVILVGTSNINASRTAKGQANLNSLFNSVYSMYAQNGVGVKLGSVNVIEWPCEQGGDAYANVSIDALGPMMKNGSALVPGSLEGHAINLFLVSSIGADGVSSSFTILGVSGALGGPPTNGTPTSGVAISTFDKLGSFNPNCSSSTCAITEQEAAFADLGTTVAHEMGHYLGLFHPSERDGTVHDPVADTPICTAKDPNLSSIITISSCLNLDSNVYAPTSKTCNTACTGYNSAAGIFCPDKIECEFNHIMWWTSKKFKEGMGTGDGNIFSPDSGMIINYNPLVQ